MRKLQSKVAIRGIKWVKNSGPKSYNSNRGENDMNNMVDTLIEKIQEKNAPIVVGLDPQAKFIPSHIME